MTILQGRPLLPLFTITQDNVERFMGYMKRWSSEFCTYDQAGTSPVYFTVKRKDCAYTECGSNWKAMNHSFVLLKTKRSRSPQNEVTWPTKVIQLISERVGTGTRVSSSQPSITSIFHVLVLSNGGICWHLRGLSKNLNPCWKEVISSLRSFEVNRLCDGYFWVSTWLD